MRLLIGGALYLSTYARRNCPPVRAYIWYTQGTQEWPTYLERTLSRRTHPEAPELLLFARSQAPAVRSRLRTSCKPVSSARCTAGQRLESTYEARLLVLLQVLVQPNRVNEHAGVYVLDELHELEHSRGGI